MMHRGGSIKVASMLAAAYSGATLFAILLDRHRLVTCNGETFPVYRGKPMYCSCGERQIDCDLFRAAAGHMLSDAGTDWDANVFAHVPRYTRLYPLDRALGGFWMSDAASRLRNLACDGLPALRRKNEAFLDDHERFVANCLAAQGSEVYVDGSKSYRRAELLAQSGRFDLKTIHLVRDGRAFCNSYIKNNRLPRTQLRTAAKHWMKNLEKVDLYQARFPDVPTLHVRYEDICTRTTEELARVSEFLDLPYDENMESNGDGTFHVIGNRMRMGFTGVVRKDRSWETELSKVEVEQVSEIMDEGLSRYGYGTR